MDGMIIHDRLSKGDFIHEKHLNDIYKYICMNLVCNMPCYSYWYEQCIIANNLYIVVNWRKKKNLLPIARKGEYTENDELLLP